MQRAMILVEKLHPAVGRKITQTNGRNHAKQFRRVTSGTEPYAHFQLKRHEVWIPTSLHVGQAWAKEDHS